MTRRKWRSTRQARSENRESRHQCNEALDLSWEVLILTDHSDFDHSNAMADRTLYVCFDAENSEVLRRVGFHVQEALSYSINRFWSFEDLFEYYGYECARSDLSLTQPSESDIGVSTAMDFLAFKAVEVYAPILWVWEIVERALSIARPHCVRVDIHDPWLKTVITKLAD